MYNEKLKIKFVEDYTQSFNTRKMAGSIFNSFAMYEEEWGADLCTRSAEQLQPVLDNILAMRSRNKWGDISILKKYVQWCIVNRVPGACDGMLNVTVAGLDKIRRRMVSSPLHLKKCLDEIFDPERTGTIEDIYRCFFWLGYAGVKEDDVLFIKASDVCFSEQCITFNGRRYPIYQESLPVFHNVVELDAFRYEHPSYSDTIFRPRVEGDSIMRGVRSSTKIMTIRSMMSRKVNAAVKEGRAKTEISFSRARLSGIFYRVYELERAGDPVDFSEAALEAMDGKAYRIEGVNKRIKVSHIKNQKEREYMEDYQRWKLAFSI